MKILDLFDQFIFDLDGVIYIGDHLTPGALSVTNQIRKNGKSIIFITNNPTKSQKQYSDKLNDLGIKNSEDEIVTSCQAVSYYLKQNFENISKKTVFVVGSENLKNEVEATGASIVDDDNALTADIVVVGSHRNFNYDEIRIASLAIQKGAFLLATNRDSSYPSYEGLLPATGSLLASIETASGRIAEIAGKPEKTIFERCLITDPRKTVLIGDNLETDISGGINAGIHTVLSLTGISKREDIATSPSKPDYIIDDLSELLYE